MREWLYGRNPVYETLRAGRRHVFQLLVAQGAHEKGRLAEIIHLCIERRVPIEYVPKGRLDALSTHHQGVMLEVSSFHYCTLQVILELAEQRGEAPLVLILDTLQDPQNLGTLLRSAESFGVHGVVLPTRRAATVTPAVVSASSGACEHLLVAQANLAQVITSLKEANIWVIGLENSSTAQLPDPKWLSGALALVVGNEAEGMRPLVRSKCDLLMRLPMCGHLDSLNAAVAGSIALYLAWQARNPASSAG